MLALAFILSSCNQKLYQDSLKKNEALEAQIVRSNKEIKDLREQKLALEDELKAKTGELTKSTGDLQASQKAIENLNVRLNSLDIQLKVLNKTLETEKGENATLISNYEQKLSDLKQEMKLAMSKKKRKLKNVVKKKI